ncbi:MAG: hypothetical protein KF910_01295 [Brevundimonas sp.]|uniref:hypothetical protein n=1 Tax=Brevundimonas sp. TaxID=1871086 RepID=UPI0025C42F1D|nr:hypothetical protein [Brevundimonas sp.]MBX3476220.1 hypothetical protein [Brevundimonas sp.]
MWRWLLIILSLMQISAAIPPWSESFASSNRTPLSAIVADPSRFHGKHITTSGYLVLEFEGDSLWVGKTDAEQFFPENGVSIEGPERRDSAARRRLDGRYVVVSGVFRADRNGHLASWPGAIVAQRIDAHGGRLQNSFLYRGPKYLVSLPWPLIIGGLGLTVAGFFLAARQGRWGRSWSWRRGPWIALAVVMTAFSALRLQGAVEQTYWAGWAFSNDIWFWFGVAETVVGLIAVIGMWAAWKLGRKTVVLAFVLLQLMVPAVHELMRIDSWRSQMTYPFEPSPSSRHWEHPNWPPSEARLAQEATPTPP